MYSVIASDGQTYGPVDLATLKTWCAEGRVTQNTNIVDSVSGRTMRASELPDLFDAFQPPPTMSPPGTQPGDQDLGNLAPGQRPGNTGNPYQQPPGSPYLRPGFGAETNVDVSGFNFGAFALSWIWGLNHKKPILLVVIPIAFVPILGPIANLGIAIYAGINGNKWAWDSGRFGTGQEMKDCERTWAIWGIVMFVLGLVIGLAAGFLLVFSSRAVPGS